MKNILLTIAFLWFTSGNAQHSELIQTTWYLTEVIHQGNSYPFVSDSEVGYPTLNFENTGSENHWVFLNFCTSGEANLIFGNENSFRLTDFVLLSWTCQIEDNYTYESRYLGIFDLLNTHSEGYLYGDFTYSILGESENRTLVITNELGNQAIYSSQNTASVYGSEKFGVKIYPNPVNDVLNFNFSEYFPHLKIQFFDINGKFILEASNSNFINVSFLQKGLYFVSIEDANSSQKFTQKFIKR